MTAVTLHDVARGLYGAWRLARFDRAGMQLADGTVAGFWKSFFAAALVLPGHVAMLSIAAGGDDTAATAAAAGADIVRRAVVEASAYVIGWVALPLFLAWLTRALDRPGTFIPCVVMYNWANVIKIAAILPTAALVAATGAAGLTPLIYAAVWVWVLAYSWYVFRAAIGCAPLTCAAIVIVDLGLSLVVSAFRDGLLSA